MSGLQNIYRPKSFKTFVGNKDVLESLQSVLARDKAPSAFLITGPSGTGKSTLGRIIKKELGCKDTDFKELNSADDRGIDGMRKLISDMKFTPYGKTKVFLLDEFHQCTSTAIEALLKGIEEPPPYMHWIFCTTNPEVLKPTFKRRCHIYELEALRDTELHVLFKRILKREKRDQFVTLKIRNKIVDLANGSAGIALKLLDMVIDMEDEERALNTLKSSGSTETDVIEICRALTAYNMPAKTKWLKVKKLLKDFKGDGESSRFPILAYFNSILLNNGGEDTFFAMQPFLKNFRDSGKAGLACACFESIFGGE